MDMEAPSSPCKERRENISYQLSGCWVVGIFIYFISWKAHSELWSISLHHFTDKEAEVQSYY